MTMTPNPKAESSDYEEFVKRHLPPEDWRYISSPDLDEGKPTLVVSTNGLFKLIEIYEHLTEDDAGPDDSLN